MSVDHGIAGVVLAGGGSTRMGRDKAQMRHNDKALIDHMIDCLNHVPTDNIMISGHLDGYDCIPDRTPGAGPGKALADLINDDDRHSGFLVVPVDMPVLTPAPLRLLMENECGACFAQRPLPAYIPACHISGDAESVRDVLNSAGVFEIDLPPAYRHDMRNVNTPEDWQDLTGTS